MNTSHILVVLIVVGALATAGCRNTWQGAQVDARRAVQKTGHGIEKVGDKIEHAGEKK